MPPAVTHQTPSNDVAVLITRPQPQADRLAEALRTMLPVAVQVVVSPLMRLEMLAVDLPMGPFGAVVLTSEAGAMAAGRLRADLPDLVHCVGPRTAEAAQAAGFVVGEVAPTADLLLPRLMAMAHAGRLIYLHGRDVSVRIDQVLTAAGIGADGVAVYAQECCRLSVGAVDLLMTKSAVLVPLYSRRSAELFFAECPDGAGAEIWPCVIAQPVLSAVPDGLWSRVLVADAPDGAAMTTAIRRGVAALLA